MKRHSCGAILYTIYQNKIYIILGKEHGEWFPFKGTSEKNETIKQTAIREILEETCNCIQLKEDEISLECNFQTSRKYYHIGLIYVDYNFMKNFSVSRKTQINDKYLEKTDIKMFNIDHILNKKFHHITSIPIFYYYPVLKKIQIKLNLSNKKSSIIHEYPLYNIYCKN
jgi:hypothetical protein